jgi:hypothetical protein
VALRFPLSALGALITFAAAGWLATASCSSGYQLTDGAYGGNNGGMGGINIPPNDGGGTDSGIIDSGMMFDAGLSDGGCQPQTAPAGCFSIGQTCYPFAGYINGGCSISLICLSYVNDAGMSLNTCCQQMPDGTYLCN